MQEEITYENNPFFERPAPVKTPGSWIINAMQGFVIFAFMIIVLYLFIATPNQVDGSSMCPNLINDEMLLTNKIAQLIGDNPLGQAIGFQYQRGDIVIFQKPGFKDFVKRVIGIPGDRVGIKDGSFYVNGQKLNEPYIFEPTIPGTFIGEGDEKVVPAGYYFLSGDNRNGSLDSRFEQIGFVKREWMKGKVFLRWLPVDRFSFIGQGVITAPNTFQECTK